MGCGVTFVKYVLFFFNLLVALAGLALLGLGVAAKLNLNSITDLVDSQFEIAPTLTIVVGSIIFIIAFYGCCGAIRESNCMLVLYAIFLIILIIVQVVLAVFVLMNLEKAEDAVTEWLNTAFNSGNPEHKAAFENMQQALQCCGTTGPTSYNIINIVDLPPSCCAPSSSICTMANAYQTGCIARLTDFLKGTGGVLGGLAIGIAAVEVVGVIFSLCLANHARNMERRSRY